MHYEYCRQSIVYELLKNDIIILTNHHRIENVGFEVARLIKFNFPFINHIGDEVENSLKDALFFNVTCLLKKMSFMLLKTLGIFFA